MQPIANWLEKLGMSEYAQPFAENGVDVSVLPHLTDQDLKDIGVLLGHRRKMLAAIADLDNTAAVAVSSPASISVPPVEAVTTTPVGERRHVTVMFCDLVDSTGIAARLDAEEWRDLVGAYLTNTKFGQRSCFAKTGLFPYYSECGFAPRVLGRMCWTRSAGKKPVARWRYVLPAASKNTDREMLEWTRTGVVARQVVNDAARKLGVLAGYAAIRGGSA